MVSVEKFEEGIAYALHDVRMRVSMFIDENQETMTDEQSHRIRRLEGELIHFQKKIDAGGY